MAAIGAGVLSIDDDMASQREIDLIEIFKPAAGDNRANLSGPP